MKSSGTSETTGSLLDPSDRRDVTNLVRIFWHETGWLPEGQDLEGIHSVILDSQVRMGVSTFSSAARIYSARATGAKPALSQRDRYSAQIDARCLKPRGYPLHWDTEGCLKTFAKARSLVSQGNRLCPEAHHWGTPRDRPRAIRGRLIPVSCGKTKNEFYRYAARSEKKHLERRLRFYEKRKMPITWRTYLICLKRSGL